jgi:hypothetical protein
MLYTLTTYIRQCVLIMKEITAKKNVRSGCQFNMSGLEKREGTTRAPSLFLFKYLMTTSAFGLFLSNFPDDLYKFLILVVHNLSSFFSLFFVIRGTCTSVH